MCCLRVHQSSISDPELLFQANISNQPQRNIKVIASVGLSTLLWENFLWYIIHDIYTCTVPVTGQIYADVILITHSIVH